MATLQIVGDGDHIQMVPIGLRGARGSQREILAMTPPIELDEVPELATGVGANVTRAYARLARDWDAGVQTLPSFRQCGGAPSHARRDRPFWQERKSPVLSLRSRQR